MSALEFTGKTTEEAVNAAVKALNIEPELLSFTILSTGSPGIFGLWAKKVRIKVDLGGAGEPVGQKTSERESQPAGQKKGFSERARTLAASGGEAKKKGPKDQEHPHWNSFAAAALDPALIPPSPFSLGLDISEEAKPSDEAQAAARIVGDLVRMMGFDVTVKASRYGSQLVVTIVCQDHRDNSLLIGKKGQVINSLQLMVNKLFCSAFKEDDPVYDHSLVPVMVDLGGYRASHQAALLEQAAKMATKVLDTGYAQLMTGLSGPERSMLVRVLKSVPGIIVQQKKDEPFDCKTLLIEPSSTSS